MESFKETGSDCFYDEYMRIMGPWGLLQSQGGMFQIKGLCFTIYWYQWLFESSLETLWIIKSTWAVVHSGGPVNSQIRVSCPLLVKSCTKHCGHWNAFWSNVVPHEQITNYMATATFMSLTQFETGVPLPSLNKNTAHRTKWSTFSWFQIL